MGTTYANSLVQVTPPLALDIELADSFESLYLPNRLKVRYGGRDGAKSWQVARILISMAHAGIQTACSVCSEGSEQSEQCDDPKCCAGTVIRPHLILCARELQASIKDSVHRLLEDQINNMGLRKWFNITQTSIVSKATGSEFIFKGLRHNANEIKSTEGITICWVEEAQLVSRDSWDFLIPTIRTGKGTRATYGTEGAGWNGAEIWVTFNPVEETDATYVLCVTEPFEDGADVKKVSYRENPWYSKTLEAYRMKMKQLDPDAYAHIWEGECRVISEAVIFKGKYIVEDFVTPTDPVPEFKHGADFGFAADPAALIRAYATQEKEWPNPWVPGAKLPAGEHLWVDEEAFGYGVEQDDLPALYNMIKTSKKWPIKADSSRPETISHVRRKAFAISAAKKWDGSVDDGIYHLRQYVLIHVHPRCKNFAIECRMYRWKVDKNTKAILPIPVDAFNHGWDALRYALDGIIQNRGASEVWKNL